MSSDVWHPRVEARRSSLASPSVARIFAGRQAGVKPMEWREVGPASARAGATPAEASPDTIAQMELLRRQCEQRVRDAHTAGERGVEASAKAAAAAEVQTVIGKLAQSIADLADMRGRLRKQAEGDAIKLALAIAKRVLRRELAVDPDAIRGLAMAALEKLQTQEIYRVRASLPQAASLAAILRQSPAHVKIEVTPDGSLAPGSIVFETNQGNLDASVDSQLQEIERGLADHLRKQS